MRAPTCSTRAEAVDSREAESDWLFFVFEEVDAEPTRWIRASGVCRITAFRFIGDGEITAFSSRSAGTSAAGGTSIERPLVFRVMPRPAAAFCGIVLLLLLAASALSLALPAGWLRIQPPSAKYSTLEPSP